MKTMLLIILSFLFNSGGNRVKGLDEIIKKQFDNYNRVEYEIVRPQNYAMITIESGSKMNRSGSYLYIPAVVRRSDGSSNKEMISVKLKLYTKALVSKRKIRRHEKLNAEDFLVTEVDVTNKLKEPIQSVDQLVNVRAKTFIKKGDLLFKEDIEFMPVIFPGEKLKAKYINGNVMIDFNVIAKQEGYYGKIIRVTKGHKVYSAKVVDERNVIIME